jgi:hypothetical protein
VAPFETVVTPPAPATQPRRGPPAALPGADVWRHARGDGAHAPCAARLAAERLNYQKCKSPLISMENALRLFVIGRLSCLALGTQGHGAHCSLSSCKKQITGTHPKHHYSKDHPLPQIPPFPTALPHTTISRSAFEREVLRNMRRCSCPRVWSLFRVTDYPAKIRSFPRDV